MTGDSNRAAGEAAYARVDRALGIPTAKPASAKSATGWRSLPVVSWVLNGPTPSLWTYARLLLLLGAVSIVAGILLSMLGALFVMVVFQENGAGVATTMLISAFTFGTPAAVFMSGSGVLAYLAARNDREAGQVLSDAVTEPTPIEEPVPDPPATPAKGIVPNMDLDDYEDHKNDDPAD
ncbi:MAG: hypothetical protein R3E76_06135 [Planctomycetota bacterium]